MTPWGPLVVVVLGLALLVRGVVVEDEPGAVPLLLLLGGVAWAVVSRARRRSAGR